MKTFRQLIEDHIQQRYEGNAAAMHRATGFPTATISAWRRGKSEVPHVETRRDIARELGMTHVELLVSMGELSESEISLPDYVPSPEVQHLAPIIDSYMWTGADLERLERVIRALPAPVDVSFEILPQEASDE